MPTPVRQSRDQFDCLVIGAGIAGLMAATILSTAGVSVRIVDKGRGPGGRMATRRWAGAVFDHGDQFFTVRDARFARWVEQWRVLGLVQPWYDLGNTGRHYRGGPGMTAIAKHLASKLDVQRQAFVEKVIRLDDQWQVVVRGGEILTASHLLVTAPVPQALTLLDASLMELEKADQHALRAVHYHRCIAALATLDRPSGITKHQGALKLSGEPIQWISDNYRKGISTEVPSVTIQSTPSFAEEHWDTKDSIRIPILLEAASEFLSANVISFHGHRWGYSQPTSAFGKEAFVVSRLRLALAGDGFAGGRVEGAAVSGLTAGESLVRMIQSMPH